MSELKPCPFCGEKPVVDDLTDHDIGFFIICENIDCPAPSLSVNSDSGTLEDATKNWNTRSKADQLALLDRVIDNLESEKYTEEQGIDNEMYNYNYGLDYAINILKQELTK